MIGTVNACIHRTPVFPNLSPYRSVLYPNETLNTNFSKTSRQKLKLNIYSYRVNLALSEYNFILNFCRRVFKKFVF